MPLNLLKISLLISLLASPVVNAALPWAVDGEPLPTLAPMLEMTMPGVVHISTRFRSTASPLNQLFGGSKGKRRQIGGSGSGVILDAAKGLIVTNAHVIDSAQNITVTLKDGRMFEATRVGVDADVDVAVLKIDAKNLSQLELTDSDALRVGDFVVAIGNPFGLKQTVTSGIVSGLGRSGLGIESYEDFIQTDASINPGNSGGALVNLRGELVGINTAIFGPNGGNVGIGFAIPVNMVKSIVDQLVEYGEVKRGRLGVGIQDLSHDLARAFNIEGDKGVVVSQVEKDSAADKAGLMTGDVVTRVNGRPVHNAAEMRNTVGLLRAGSTVTMDILREGKPKSLTAVISIPKMAKLSGKRLGSKLKGAMFADRGGEDNRGIKLVSVEMGAAAMKSGLQEGDVIMSINRISVDTVEEMEAIISASKSKAMLLNVVRGNSGLFLLIQ